MSSDDIAIRVSNISKHYEIYISPRDRLKQFVMPRIQRLARKAQNRYFREFWAVKEVSFEVQKGETVAIIGRNGSGKSTLLQMICGTLSPTSGCIKITGRVAALLELGSGFNSEFSGRDNVYMNAALLGLSGEEVDARFDDIVAFADIGQFIDQPVKNYSSGMIVRLAFSVIAHSDADILVIDEALAVGDAFFQQKCMRFLRTFQANLGTVLFVSHDTAAVIGLCSKAVLLDAGSILCSGQPEEISKVYLGQIYADPERRANCASNGVIAERVRSNMRVVNIEGAPYGVVFSGDMRPETRYVVSNFRKNAERFGDAGATIIDAGFMDQNENICMTVNGGQFVTLFVRLKVHTEIQHPAFGFMIKNSLGEYLFTEGTDVHFRDSGLYFKAGNFVTARFSFAMPHLNKGQYMMNIAFADGLGAEHIQHCWLHDAIQLDVVVSRLAHGYCGMNDIAMSIHVDSLER